jgi:hypothetical protein
MATWALFGHRHGYPIVKSTNWLIMRQRALIVLTVSQREPASVNASPTASRRALIPPLEAAKLRTIHAGLQGQTPAIHPTQFF